MDGSAVKRSRRSWPIEPDSRLRRDVLAVTPGHQHATIGQRCDGGEPAGQTEILVTGAFRAAFEGIRNYSLAATYGVLILSMLVVFASVYKRILKSQGDVF